MIFHQTEKQIKTVVGVDTYKNLGAFLEKKNFNFSPNLIYLMTGTFATRGATWEDFCRHLRSAHLCNSHQLATLSIILNEFGDGFRIEKKGESSEHFFIELSSDEFVCMYSQSFLTYTKE